MFADDLACAFVQSQVSPQDVVGTAALKPFAELPPNKSVNPTFTSLRFVHAGYLHR